MKYLYRLFKYFVGGWSVGCFEKVIVIEETCVNPLSVFKELGICLKKQFCFSDY